MNRGCQSIYKKDEKVFVGEWDPRILLGIVNSVEYEWEGKRVLDIGANTGGFSLELARLGARVVAAEPDPYGNNMRLSRDVLRELASIENLDLVIVSNDLFSCHELGEFDVIFCFGLLYHFRYFVYSLDYLSSLNSDVLYVSTQTHPGSDLALFNRVNPGIMKEGFFGDDIVLTGWHPTRPLFEKMLEWSGFSNIQSLTEEQYDFPRKMQGATNSSYYRAELVTSKQPQKELRTFYPR